MVIVAAMLIVLALSWAYVRFGASPQATWLLYGIKPVMIAIILQALWELGRKAVDDFVFVRRRAGFVVDDGKRAFEGAVDAVEDLVDVGFGGEAFAGKIEAEGDELLVLGGEEVRNSRFPDWLKSGRESFGV